jgi:hypothetical protein
MLDPISTYKFFQQKHLEAPLLAERDLFLPISSLLEQVIAN